MDRGMIMELGDIAIGGLWPDLTIILDLPAGVGMKRIGVVRKRLKKDDEQAYEQLGLFGDRLETRASDYHSEVRRIYRSLDKTYRGKVRSVNAKGSETEVFDRILNVISEEFRE